MGGVTIGEFVETYVHSCSLTDIHDEIDTRMTKEVNALRRAQEREKRVQKRRNHLNRRKR